MKTKNTRILFLSLLAGTLSLHAQTVYIPSGIAGIGSTVLGNNNVGVGTSNAPATKLHVMTSVANDGIRVEQTGAHAAALGLYNTATGLNGHNWALLSTNSSNSQGAGRLLFYDYSAPLSSVRERMIIDNIGNVGIGVTSEYTYTPKVRLHVHGGSLKFTGTDPIHGAPNIFWGGTSVSAPDGEWALEYNSGMNGLNFWRPNNSHNGSGGTQATVNNILFLSNYNNVGIGTSTPHNSSMLTVNGKVLIGNPSAVNMPGPYGLYVQTGLLTNIVKVATVNGASWSDYVFEPGYHRNSLGYVERFVKENKHLPNVPSAQEVEKNGIDMAGMDACLLRQIEELWLHVIELKKENEALRREINDKN